MLLGRALKTTRRPHPPLSPSNLNRLLRLATPHQPSSSSPEGSSEQATYPSHVLLEFPDPSHEYSLQTSDWDVSLDGVTMACFRSIPRDNVYHETYGAVASSSGQSRMEEHLSRSMKKVESKDLKSGCLIGKGPSSIVYETTLDKKSYARKDFLRVPSHIFEREAAALVGLYHANVLGTYCWTVDDGSCSLLVELMDNDLLNLMQKIKDSRRKQSSGSGSASQRTHLIDLQKFIKDGRNASTGTVSEIDAAAPLVYPFDLPEALKVMVQVAQGVKFLHKKGVAHGDLKPKNILVASKGKVSSSSFDENMTFKVADFGLYWTKMKSRILVSRRARNLELARWRAPELLELTGLREDQHESSTASDWDSDSSDETIGDLAQKFTFKDMARADIYNFATTCSQVLTGEDPYPELSLNDLVRGILSGLRPRLPPTCPARLRVLLERCWGKKAKRRPSFKVILSELKDLQASLTRSGTVVKYNNNVTESSSSRIDSFELELVPEHNAVSRQSGGGPKSSSALEIRQIVDAPIEHKERSIRDLQGDSFIKGSHTFSDFYWHRDLGLVRHRDQGLVRLGDLSLDPNVRMSDSTMETAEPMGIKGSFMETAEPIRIGDEGVTP